jgi:CxxC-x17-CxxC domain-containing protein
MEYQDKPLTCVECGQQFIFTAGEQEFYDRKGFKEIPKRCRPCREARKTRGPSGNARGAEGNGSREERAPRGEGGGRGGRGGSRELFDAVCATCGKPARVPFKPAAGRPVYCRECYSTKRDEGE